MRLAIFAWMLLLGVRFAIAFERSWIVPNPSYSRDLAMGTSTVALPYAPQCQGMNPAGLALFPPEGPARLTAVFNAVAPYLIRNYDGTGRSFAQQATDVARMVVFGVGGQYRALTVMAFLSQPVMATDTERRYSDYLDKSNVFDQYSNSVQAVLALHPRVSVGGRLDRYYRGDDPEGESFSYGVILRPRGIRLGVQYQRFPASGVRQWHPLDRRSDAATTAGVSTTIRTLTVTGQIMNLAQPNASAFLEPHAGFEWRPARVVALRGGGMQFSRSRRWALTTGLSLGDANWFRPRRSRLAVADDIVQCAVAWRYESRTPELMIGSLTVTVRL